MKIQSLFGILLMGLSLTSCKKELEPQPSSATPSADVAQTPTQPNAAPAPGQQPVAQQVAAPQMTTQVTPGQPVKVAAGMNPPHGQPGHRCDIAVGAPLNSPPGKAPAQPMTITPGQTTQTGTRITPAGTGAAPAILAPNANTAVAATAPGMNPPHGQPGHRCDIAVGAPLNSPPKTEEKKAEPAKTTESQFTVSDPATEKKAE
ncbi:hypothetical protein [Flavobacterium sp.]|uniref:hypothetical protein n=1 Tax=Flavobacterium sp. TaxID=239 RepID=UPI0039E65C47